MIMKINATTSLKTIPAGSSIPMGGLSRDEGIGNQLLRAFSTRNQPANRYPPAASKRTRTHPMGLQIGFSRCCFARSLSADLNCQESRPILPSRRMPNSSSLTPRHTQELFHRCSFKGRYYLVVACASTQIPGDGLFNLRPIRSCILLEQFCAGH